MENTSLYTDRAVAGDALYHDLRNRILSFDILPGDALSENALAAEMQVSRALVRDTMARLVEEGYVTVYPQSGTLVSLIDIERVRQAMFLRVVLEHSVVEALCKKELTPAQLTMIEESLRAQRALLEDHQVLAMLREDDRMHHLLYEFSGRSYTEEIFRMLDGDQMRIRYLQMHTFSYNTRVQFSPMSGWENCLIEHRMLMDAIRKCDAEAACLIDMNHINTILWNADNLQKIYPQYFSESQRA